jgi:hypothetical protein
MTVIVDKKISDPGDAYIRFRQSTIHGFVMKYMPTNNDISELLESGKKIMRDTANTQKRVKVIVFNDSAYWIHDNQFYTASLKENGEIDTDAAVPVTADDLSEEEINVLMNIVDDLRRKEDDGSSSGN